MPRYINRFDRGYSRRKFLNDAARGVLGAGVLMPLSQAIATNGEINKAYPDELLSIEGYTKGKIKTGDIIDANNVQYVKDLLEPVRYEQILKQGRKLKVGKTTNEIMRLSPWEYIEATLKNNGKAGFDARGNVVNKADGQPWIGGNPFPDPKNGLELFAAQTLNWGRHDASFYAMKLYATDPGGSVRFTYTGGWCEYSPVGRVSMVPRPSGMPPSNWCRKRSSSRPNRSSSRGRRSARSGSISTPATRSSSAWLPTIAT